MSTEHTPAPWTNKTAVYVAAGDDRVISGGRPFPVAVRVLSEPNYQLAMKAVNAHDALVAALEAHQANLIAICGGEADVMDDASAGVYRQGVAALALARGGK